MSSIAAISGGYSSDTGIKTTMNQCYSANIPIYVEDKLSKFLRRYGKYIVDTNKVLYFIINNLDTVAVMKAVMEEVELTEGYGDKAE